MVHVHNVYPQLSPSVLRAARDSGARVVHTVHNYRLSCLNGTHFRDGGVCTACTGRKVKTPAIVHGCYRDSRLQSVPMVVSRAMGNAAWMGDVDTFIALTPFMKQRLELEGVPSDRIVVRPSWATDVGRPDLTSPRAAEVLFAGRLDHTKGVPLLLEAWQRMVPGSRQGAVLRIAGS